MRSAPKTVAPVLCNIVAFKAGMTHFNMIDDTESATKGAEISKACTVLEIPETSVYGIRFYGKDPLTNYKIVAAEVQVGKQGKSEEELNKMRPRLKEFSDITALMVAQPNSTGIGQHHPVKFESPVGGKSVEEKFNFVVGMLSKHVGANDVFKNGEFIDVISISKGKGWQGAVKRFGISKQPRKTTQMIRHVGCLGPATPPKVLFSVPHAGQLGFNYRTEHNKRIFKIGDSSDKSINPSAGFMNYGILKNGYMLVGGSVPGPVKGLVRIRKAIRRAGVAIKEPALSYIAIAR
jgi:large subunit ribosomal protein L3